MTDNAPISRVVINERQVWETPRVVSSPISDTAGGPTRGAETGGDIGPS